MAARDNLGPLVGARIRPYFVAPVADGGVHVEWHGPDAELHLEVGPDARLGYLVVRDRATETHYEEANDVDLSSLLKKLAEAMGDSGDGPAG